MKMKDRPKIVRPSLYPEEDTNLQECYVKRNVRDKNKLRRNVRDKNKLDELSVNYNQIAKLSIEDYNDSITCI